MIQYPYITQKIKGLSESVTDMDLSLLTIDCLLSDLLSQKIVINSFLGHNVTEMAFIIWKSQFVCAVFCTLQEVLT